MLKIFLSCLFAVMMLTSFGAIAKDKKGEDCDPSKVDLTKNACQCDPKTHDWVFDECLVKCDIDTVRVGKGCQTACKAGEVSFNGGCVKGCEKGFVLNNLGQCAKEATCAEMKVTQPDFICPEDRVTECGNNSELVDGQCLEKCGNNSERVGTLCLEKCGNHKERIGQECLEPCGNHKDRVGHDCRDKCKEGYLRSNTGECIACEFKQAKK